MLNRPVLFGAFCWTYHNQPRIAVRRLGKVERIERRMPFWSEGKMSSPFIGLAIVFASDCLRRTPYVPFGSLADQRPAPPRPTSRPLIPALPSSRMMPQSRLKRGAPTGGDLKAERGVAAAGPGHASGPPAGS